MQKMWLEQVDSISQYLKILCDRHIPVLWRPYHEMNGSGSGGVTELETKDSPCSGKCCTIGW